MKCFSTLTALERSDTFVQQTFVFIFSISLSVSISLSSSISLCVCACQLKLKTSFRLFVCLAINYASYILSPRTCFKWIFMLASSPVHNRCALQKLLSKLTYSVCLNLLYLWCIPRALQICQRYLICSIWYIANKISFLHFKVRF